jgi:hypothetical protein
MYVCNHLCVYVMMYYITFHVCILCMVRVCIAAINTVYNMSVRDFIALKRSAGKCIDQ